MVYFSRAGLSEMEDLSGCTHMVRHAAAHTQMPLQPEQALCASILPNNKKEMDCFQVSGVNSNGRHDEV